MSEPLYAKSVNPKACDGTDAARGILASVVFLSHFVGIFIGYVHAVNIAASLSVLFFFAISGFVISGSLVRHTAPGGVVDLAGFAKKRFFRIMPPLIATFLLIEVLEFSLVLGGVLADGKEVAGIHGYHLKLMNVAASLSTIGAIGDLGGALDGPLWSLQYEIRCYLTAALIAWLLTSRATAKRKIIVVAALFAYWFVAVFTSNEGLLSQLPWLLSFAAGFFVFRYRSALSATAWISTAAGVALSAVAYFILSIWHGPTVLRLFALCICGLAFAPIVFALHGVAIKSRALASLGRVSYTLYIAHFPVLLALYFSIKAAPTTMYVPLAGTAVAVAAVGCFALGQVVEHPSAQLAWTERHLSRIRKAIAVRA